jgi:hypothetical protein
LIFITHTNCKIFLVLNNIGSSTFAGWSRYILKAFIEKQAPFAKEDMKLILLVLVISSAFAQEFSSFKLKGVLKEKAKQIRGRRLEKAGHKDYNPELYLKLFGPKRRTESAIIAEDESDGDILADSLLFQKIKDMLAGNIENIGQAQVQTLLNHQQDFGGGVENFSGFSWEKPAGSFSIGVNRQLSPDLFNSERWIVHDTLVVNVNAATFLNRLADADLIDIDAGVISAYAGVSFQRVYTTYHFAGSYIQGLTADFKKLFLPFLSFSPKKVFELGNDEIIIKEDYFSAKAGAIVASPPFHGFSFAAGANVEYNKKSKVSVHSLGVDDPKKPDESIRISAEKFKSKAVGVVARLQLDFFNLLKITLLEAEVEYEYGETSVQDLSFYHADKPQVTNGSQFAKEFRKLLNGKFMDINFFQDRVVQHEERLNENLSSRYGIFVLSKMKQSETEFVRIIRGDESKTFFRYHNESMKVVQSFFSKLFDIALNKIPGFGLGVKNMSLATKTVDMEYESPHETNDMIVDSEEQFSIVLTYSYEAAKTHKKRHRFYNKKARSYLAKLTPLAAKHGPLIASHKLRGPLEIKNIIRVDKEGLKYFHELAEDDVFYIIAKNCRMSDEKAAKYRSKDYRRRKLRRWRAGKKACVKRIGKAYMKYMNTLRETGQMNLKKLKKFLTNFASKNDRASHFLGLFGPDKVFVHGSFSAKTDGGLPFQTFFQEGDFRGLGVIDNYRRAQ